MTLLRNTITFPSQALDQAGRQRGSLPIPLGDYKLMNDRLPYFFDTEVNGTGAVVYDSIKRAHSMTTAADGDWAIVQTYMHHNYFAGKAQMVEFTAFNFDCETNITKRSGYYHDINKTTPFQTGLDGFWLEAGSDGTHHLKIYNNGTEILDLPRSQWADPLDGTGKSKVNVDWSKFNVIQANFLWLGGTGLRMSVVIGSSIVEFINYEHANSANADKLIFSSPNQPIRHEIIQSGSGSGTFKPVCSTVITEGSDSSANIGSIRAIHTAAGTPILAAAAGTEYVIKAIRLKSTHYNVTLDVLDVDPFVSSNNDFYMWRLVVNPTIAGGSLSWTGITDSAVEEATGNGTLTSSGGYVLGSGYGAGRAIGSKTLDSARKLGQAIDGTRDFAVLTITPLSGYTNLNSFGSIIYKEFI